MSRLYGYWIHAYYRPDDPDAIELLAWDAAGQWSRLSGKHHAWLATLWTIPLRDRWTGMVEWEPLRSECHRAEWAMPVSARQLLFRLSGTLAGLITLSGVHQSHRVLLDLTAEPRLLVRQCLHLQGDWCVMRANAWTPPEIPDYVQLAVEAHHRVPDTLDDALSRGRTRPPRNLRAGPAAGRHN